MISAYYEKIQDKLATAFESQTETLAKCSEVISQSIAVGGILHLFGTGHSHMLAEELFYRAGGLVPVNAILEPAFMLHEGAELSTRLERMEGLAEQILQRHAVEPKDVMIIITNSGRNPVPVEMALLAKEKGLYTIGLGAGIYRDIESRHSTGKKLIDVVDIFLDNASDMGDACMPIPNTSFQVGATSTVIGAALLNAIAVEVACQLSEKMDPLPIFISANGKQNADQHNQHWMNEYRRRVRSF